jgi:hypothetical protein
MAKNDIVLLDSLVQKAASRFARNDQVSETFELFCFEQILKDLDPSYEDLESGWTDGPEDGGIDALYVYVDGRLADHDVKNHSSRREPVVRLVVCSVKHADSFQQGPLNSLLSSLTELLDLRKQAQELRLAFAKAVLDQRELFRRTFVSLAERRPRVLIDIYYCSRGDTATLAGNLTQRAKHLQESVERLFSDANVTVKLLGASELLALARQQPSYSLRLKFVESYISREGLNYIILTRLPDYFDFVSDEYGGLRRYLFESNVRDYLGEVQINQDIARTLQRAAGPNIEDFWWLNNGVTIIATHATVIGKELHLENVQIVNGLQTTETIYSHFRQQHQSDDERAILLKVILTSDEQARSRIIKATNYQNTVDLASLRGLDKIQQDIEHFLADRGWYYDRRKNYYKNQGRPADRIISIGYLAAAVRAIALGDPGGSQRQRSRSLRDEAVYAQVFNPGWDLNVYLACVEIVRGVESALQIRGTAETLPIAQVHFIGHVYVCQRLGKYRYRPNEVAALAKHAPHEADILSIRDELRRAVTGSSDQVRNVEAIMLNRTVVDIFLRQRFGLPEPDRSRRPRAFDERETRTVAADGHNDSVTLTLAVSALLDANANVQRVIAGYDVIEAAIDELTGSCGSRAFIKRAVLEMSVGSGRTRKTTRRALTTVFSRRDDVASGDIPLDSETSRYVAIVAWLVAGLGFGHEAAAIQAVAGDLTYDPDFSEGKPSERQGQPFLPETITKDSVVAGLIDAVSKPEPEERILAAYNILRAVVQSMVDQDGETLPFRRSLIAKGVGMGWTSAHATRVVGRMFKLKGQIITRAKVPTEHEAVYFVKTVKKLLAAFGFDGEAPVLTESLAKVPPRVMADDEVREETRHMIARVRKTGLPQTSGLLNPYLRRIVHLMVQEDGDLETRSVGEGLQKMIVVSLKAESSSE